MEEQSDAGGVASGEDLDGAASWAGDVEPFVHGPMLGARLLAEYG